MPQQDINVGTVANDGTGDSIRSAFQKTQANFDEVFGGQVPMPSSTVAGLPSAATAGLWIYVTDETGGAIPAFSDGTNWRRVTDRAVVS